MVVFRETLPDEVERLLNELPEEYRGEWRREDMAWVVRRLAERIAARYGGVIVEGEDGFWPYFPCEGDELARVERLYDKAWEIGFTELLSGWRDSLRLLITPAGGTA